MAKHNLRLLEQDHAEDAANAEDWGRKAKARLAALKDGSGGTSEVTSGQ